MYGGTEDFPPLWQAAVKMLKSAKGLFKVANADGDKFIDGQEFFEFMRDALTPPAAVRRGAWARGALGRS